MINDVNEIIINRGDILYYIQKCKIKKCKIVCAHIHTCQHKTKADELLLMRHYFETTANRQGLIVPRGEE